MDWLFDPTQWWSINLLPAILIVGTLVAVGEGVAKIIRILTNRRDPPKMPGWD